MGKALSVLSEETVRLAADKDNLAAKQRASRLSAELLESAEKELIQQNNTHQKVIRGLQQK